MKEPNRILLVPWLFLIVPLLVYLVVIGSFKLLAWRVGIRFDLLAPEIVKLQGAWLIFWGIAYGIYRGMAFHPVYTQPYWEWLANTPWRAGMALPLGPVHLVWQDGVYMMIPTVLCLGISTDLAILLWIAMLAAYLLILLIHLARTGPYFFVTTVLLMLPFVWLIDGHIWFPFGLLGAFYILAYYDLRRSWLTFPWNLSERHTKRAEPAQAASLGWPFNRLNACEPVKMYNLPVILACSLLVGWYLFSILHCIHRDKAIDARETETTIQSYGLLIAMLRGIVFCVFRSPPLSILGRIARGHLILPGYDKVFIAPLLIGVVAILGPMGLRAGHVYPPLAAAIMATTLLALVLGLPPTLRHFILTGHYRMALVSQQQTTAQRKAASR